MRMGMKKVKLWSTASLTYAGIAAAITVGMILLTGGFGEADRAEVWQTLLFQFSTMLLLSGMLIQTIAGVGLFQVYFSVLLSMGSTRKEIIRTFFLSQGATALLTSLLAGLVWGIGRYVEKNPPQEGLFGLGLLWFFLIAFGIQLLGSALGTALGAVALRWKTAGAVIMMIVFILIGGVTGWGIVSLDRSETGFLMTHIGTQMLMPLVCMGMFAAGLGLNLCAAGFARFVTRNAEAKA